MELTRSRSLSSLAARPLLSFSLSLSVSLTHSLFLSFDFYSAALRDESRRRVPLSRAARRGERDVRESRNL